jgi:hypothetical protein
VAPGVDRAGVSAPHGDHEVGGQHYFVGEGFGELRDHGDTDLVQHLHHQWATGRRSAIGARYSALGGWARALSAPQPLISGWSEGEFVDQLSDAAFDVVADGADVGEVLAGGIVQVVPGFVAFAGEDGGRRRRSPC